MHPYPAADRQSFPAVQTHDPERSQALRFAVEPDRALPGHEATHPAAAGVPSSRATKFRVLVTCEDVRLCEQARLAAAGVGLYVTTAGTVESARRILALQPQDVALVDLHLADARALLETLRSTWSWVQVVLFGSSEDMENVKRAIRLDVADFLSKPCSQHEISAVVARACRRRMNNDTAPALAATSPASLTSAPLSSLEPDPDVSPALPTLETLERTYIFEALQRNRGNREATARELGISVRKLYYRLRQYNHEGKGSFDKKD